MASQDEFNKAQQAIQQILSQNIPQGNTKKGSILRELVVRPYAAIYTKVLQLISDWLYRSSVSYLETSVATSDSIADLVASNFFVTRNQGQKASGTVVLTLSNSQSRLTTSTVLIADGHKLIPTKQTIITATVKQDTDQINYVRAMNIGNKYYASVAVTSVDEGYIEIPENTTVQTSAYIPNFLSGSILSAITGGGQTQTNAQLMARCKLSCAANTGSTTAIKKTLLNSGLGALSCSINGAYSVSNFTAMQSSLNIPVLSSIDIYTKTQNQAQTQILDCAVISDSSDCTYVMLDASTVQNWGIIRVLNVQAQGHSNLQYKLEYTSTDAGYNQEAARLSKYQRIKLTFTQLQVGQIVRITYSTIKKLAQIDDYMQNTQHKLVGTTTTIKAAVPVTVSLRLGLKSLTQLSQDTLEQLKIDISKIVNNKQVGDYRLTVDQIAQSIQALYPDITVRLPYQLSIVMPMTNNGLYSFMTSNGIIDLSTLDCTYFWNQIVYYFSAAPANITLDVE